MFEALLYAFPLLLLALLLYASMLPSNNFLLFFFTVILLLSVAFLMAYDDVFLRPSCLEIGFMVWMLCLTFFGYTGFLVMILDR